MEPLRWTYYYCMFVLLYGLESNLLAHTNRSENISSDITMWIFNCKLLPWLLLVISLVVLCWNTLCNYAIINAIRSRDIVQTELEEVKYMLEELKVRLENGDWIDIDQLTDRNADYTSEENNEVLFGDLLNSFIRKRPKESFLQIYGKVEDLVAKENKVDQVGMADFALESSGGQIVTVRNTKCFDPHGAESKTLFGIPVCESCMGPQAILQASCLPGQCWAFKGSSGSVVIKLLGYVFITQVSLEHIAKKFSPTGKIDSAPREFSVWGLSDKNDVPGELFGRFIYDSNGSRIQKFKVSNVPRSYMLVELKIHSNHGNNIFTCVYRFRVHGILDDKTPYMGKE